jgi:GMP synthase (glutamine-hydrolysing)
MRIHYLQHVPFEGLGCIEPWALHQGHSLSATALFAGDALPDPLSFDWLIVMGGPMGVHDEMEFPWLVQETQFIRQCVRQGKKILGICLGAQLIARALGADVYPNQHKEIGWHPVTSSPGADGTGLGPLLPQTFFAFHWHGDTFGLPNGAVHLAQSEACRHQAFFYPPAVLGFQFHLESTFESIGELIDSCNDELVTAPYIQNRELIQSRRDLVLPSNDLMRRVLEFISKIP